MSTRTPARCRRTAAACEAICRPACSQGPLSMQGSPHVRRLTLLINADGRSGGTGLQDACPAVGTPPLNAAAAAPAAHNSRGCVRAQHRGAEMYTINRCN